MILPGWTNIEHFTVLHSDKWICCAARLPHLNVPRHFTQTHFLFFKIFPQREGREGGEHKSGEQNREGRVGCVWDGGVMNVEVKRSDLTLR